MKKRIWIICLMFTMLHLCQAQDETSFHAFFQELEFEMLPVYSHTRHPDDYLATNPYLFKGQKIDSIYYPLFNLLRNEDKWNESVYYACHKFFINYNSEAFLIRESKYEGTEHHIHCLIFDHQKGKFIQTKTLSFAYGYEGNFGAMESWIIDVNKDGQKDIINRTWRETYLGEDAIYIYHDTIQLSIFENDTFLEIELKDTLLQKQLKEDFPFHKEPSVSYPTGKLLEKIINIKKNEHQWCIVVGSDTSLEAAKHEEKRAEKIIGYDYKYDLDIRQFDIYYDENKKRYYSIIKRFKNKNEADIALREIQRIFNKTAFVVDFETWCPNPTYQEHGYYHCVD